MLVKFDDREEHSDAALRSVSAQYLDGMGIVGELCQPAHEASLL